MTIVLLGFLKDKAFLESFGRFLNVNSPLYSIREQFEWFFKVSSCDLFWSPHFNIPLLPILAKKRVTTIHDIYHLAFYKKLTFFQKIYASIMYRAALLYSDRIITVSQFSADQIRQYLSVGVKKLVIIPHGVQLKYQEKVRKPFVLAVGNNKAHKNIKRLKQAVDDLNLELVFVGKDHNEISDETLVSLYQEATLLAFPSLYEGFGYPPLEAMSCGCPVVVSNLSIFKETCGRAAEYVDPYDVKSIKQGIKNVFYNRERQKELRHAGFSQVKKFSLSHSIESHLRLFNELSQ